MTTRDKVMLAAVVAVAVFGFGYAALAFSHSVVSDLEGRGKRLEGGR